MRKNVVVLTGAGISAESGIRTFRDSNGLWEEHDVMDVASPQGWTKNPELVLRFYNERRAQAGKCLPNEGHLALKKLEAFHDVMIITQNVDDLHEKAGSSRILHLHGELNKMRSSADPSMVMDISGDIHLGELCEKGSQLRPHIVWFGEDVPLFPVAVQLCSIADILIIAGTSMVVYPANTLVEYVPDHCKIYLVDPHKPEYSTGKSIQYILEPATTGLPKVVEQLFSEAGK